MASTLPTELIDTIVDHFHGDTKTLRNCSTVCKRWVSSSRSHLFSDVKLDMCNGRRFLALLQSQGGPSIAPHIRTLSLQMCLHLAWFLESMPILAHNLRPHVALKVTILNSGKVPHDISIIPNYFQTITNLDIWINCGKFHEVATFISSFPLLENLVISGTDWRYDNETAFPPSEVAISSRLRAIEYRCVKPYFLRWLTHHRPLPRLQTMILGLSDHEAAGPVGAYFERHGASLRHLTLNSKASTRAVLSMVDIGLAHLTDLRTLAVNVWEHPVQHLLHLLPQVGSSLVEEIEFEAWFPPNDDIEFWLRLDKLMTSPRFPSLHRVTIHITEKYLQDVKRHLSKSSKLLHFLDYRGEILV